MTFPGKADWACMLCFNSDSHSQTHTLTPGGFQVQLQFSNAGTTSAAFFKYLYITLDTVDGHHVSSKFTRCLFVLYGSNCSTCAAPVMLPKHCSLTLPINQSHLTRSCFFLYFPLVNSSAAVIRSVYFPHAGFSHVGHWLVYTKWVAEQPLGSTEVQWFNCWIPLLPHNGNKALLVFVLNAFFLILYLISSVTN